MSDLRIRIDFQGVKSDEKLNVTWFAIDFKEIKYVHQLTKKIVKTFKIKEQDPQLVMSDFPLPKDGEVKALIRDRELIVVKPEQKNSKRKSDSAKSTGAKKSKTAQSKTGKSVTNGQKSKDTPATEKKATKKSNSSVACKDSKKKPTSQSQNTIKTPRDSSKVKSASKDSLPSSKAIRRFNKESEQLRNESIGIFCPVVVLQRLKIDDKLLNDLKRENIPETCSRRKARKTFPIPFSTNEQSLFEEKEEEDEAEEHFSPLDKIRSKLFELCEPLVGCPNVGDYVAFRMIEKDQNLLIYAGSEIIRCLVLNVDETLNEIDVLVLNDRVSCKGIPDCDISLNTIRFNLDTIVDKRIIQRAEDD